MSDYKNKPWTLGSHPRAHKGHVVHVVDGKPEILASIIIAYPVDGAGPLRVAMASGGKWSYSVAKGYGYDKLVAAMAGMVVGGHELGDHSDHKGRPTLQDLCRVQGWLYLAP